MRITNKERPIDLSFNPGLKELNPQIMAMRRGKPAKSPSPQQLSPKAAYDAGLKLRMKAKLSDFNPCIQEVTPKEQSYQSAPASNASLDASLSKSLPHSSTEHYPHIKEMTSKLPSPGKQKLITSPVMLSPMPPKRQPKVFSPEKECIATFETSPHHKLPSVFLDVSQSRTYTLSFLPKVHNPDDSYPVEMPEYMPQREKHRHTSLPPFPAMKRVALPTKSPPVSPSASLSPAGSPTRMQRMKRAVLTKLKALPSVKIQVEKAPQRGVVDTALLTRWHKLPKVCITQLVNVNMNCPFQVLKVKCSAHGLPILYSKRYDVKLPLRMRLQNYSILWDKPSRVMSSVASMLYTPFLSHSYLFST